MHHDAENSFLADELLDLGATGKFPGGKLTSTDAGEIVFEVAADLPRQLVIVDFGTSVRSLALSLSQVQDLEAALFAARMRCRGIV